MQPSPELRKQTSAVYNQAPSSSGEEVINKLPTWNCRRNPAGCMQGSIWARGRKFKWVVVVQKIPLGAPMDTAPGQNVRVFILNRSLWQNNALSWLATLLLTQTNHYKPNPPTHLSWSILWSQGYVDKFCWNQADICQSNRHFPGIKHQEELCWLQVWKEPCGACACLPFGVQGEAGISCRSKVTPSLRPGDQTEFTPNLLLDSFVYLQKSHPRTEDLNYIF